MDDEMLTRKEFADKMRVDVKTVSRWANKGKVPFKRYGRKYLFPKSATVATEGAAQ